MNKIVSIVSEIVYIVYFRGSFSCFENKPDKSECGKEPRKETVREGTIIFELSNPLDSMVSLANDSTKSSGLLILFSRSPWNKVSWKKSTVYKL